MRVNSILPKRDGFREILIGESSIDKTGQVMQVPGVTWLEMLGKGDQLRRRWLDHNEVAALPDLQRFLMARATIDRDLIIIISTAKMKIYFNT